MVKTLRRYKPLVIIIILFILYNSLFINKALLIDDPFTVSLARAVNIDFFKPPQVFFSNPPLLGYYYAPIIRMFGERELWLHMFYLPFPVLVIISMFVLSLRFANKSLFPVLFLISSSAFILTSQSIMLDIPFLGFFLAAVVAFIYGIDRNNNLFLVLSGLFAGISILTKYSGLMVVPILFIYALLNSAKKKTIFLLIPVLIFLLWNLYTILFYQNAIFFSALSWKLKNYLLNRIGIRIFASLSFLSGSSVIILFLIPFLLRKKRNLFCSFLALATGIFPFITKDIFGSYSFWEKGFLAVLFIASSFVILLIFSAGFQPLFKKHNKDSLFLSSWFFLMLAFIILTNFIAARFLLLLLPPLFLLIYNELSSGKIKIVKLKVKFISFIFISFVFSTILAIGDYQFAGVYRDFVNSLKNSVPEDLEIYFYPGSYYSAWGYSYYLEKYYPQMANNRIEKDSERIENAIFITPSEPVLPIVTERRKSVFNEFLDDNKILIKSVYYNGNVFLHNQKFRTGFYSHDWGLLPFYLSIRKVPLETFEVYGLHLYD